ncbi:hypothetical protein NHH03_13800 [Stieleria sp. TO1_6]|uniref:hypothetical protein n=1 Tax=Stieleria tagensis TaxID=2956795 RepID=UPI00209AAE2B|nr:hypothetical protein [Stieleria tagensis]MCO8122817.1 hypothetical protein [Stieleria tagensis]
MPVLGKVDGLLANDGPEEGRVVGRLNEGFEVFEGLNPPLGRLNCGTEGRLLGRLMVGRLLGRLIEGRLLVGRLGLARLLGAWLTLARLTWLLPSDGMLGRDTDLDLDLPLLRDADWPRVAPPGLPPLNPASAGRSTLPNNNRQTTSLSTDRKWV